MFKKKLKSVKLKKKKLTIIVLICKGIYVIDNCIIVYIFNLEYNHDNIERGIELEERRGGGMRVFKKKVLLSNQTWMKKRRRRERSRDERSQVDNIPLDLTLEILSRLPAKSIMRHRCVSKLSSSFTTLPSFIKSFASLSSARPLCLLLTFEFDKKQSVVSFPQNKTLTGLIETSRPENLEKALKNSK